MSVSLRAVYLQSCSSLGVRPNSGLANLLPADAGATSEFTTLDLRLNIVGVRGLIPLLTVVQAAPRLRTLILSAQNINNDGILPICGVISGHPALESIDLSGNPITLPAAKHLLTAVRANANIKSLALKDTLIPPLAIQWVDNALATNCGGARPPAVDTAAAASPTAASTDADANASPRKGVGFATFAFGGGGEEDHASDKAMSDDAGSNGSASEPDDVADVDDAEEERQRTLASRVAGRRATVSGTSYNEDAAKGFRLPQHPKDLTTSAQLRDHLWSLPILAHLDDREIETVVSAMAPRAFVPGEILYSKGSEDDHLYVISKGYIKREAADGSAEILKAGESFGETAVMTVGVREDAIYAATEDDVAKLAPAEVATFAGGDGVHVFAIDRETYLHIVRTAAIARHDLYDAFLQRVGFLQGITAAERSRLCEALSPVVFKPGEMLIEYGSVGKWFYIITEGVVEVIGRNKDDNTQRVKVCEFGEGECVGELEFIRKHLCVADVVAKSEVRCARMSRRHFQMVMGPVTDVLKRISEDPTGKYKYYQQRTADGALDDEPE